MTTNGINLQIEEQKLQMAHTIVRKLIDLITNVLVPVLIFVFNPFTPLSLSRRTCTQNEREREREVELCGDEAGKWHLHCKQKG